MFRYSAEVSRRKMIGTLRHADQYAYAAWDSRDAQIFDRICGSEVYADSAICSAAAAYREAFRESPLLRNQFLVDQLSRNLQGNSGLMRQSLGASQSSIGRTNRASRGEHRTIAVEHHKASVLIGQPAKSSKRNQSVSADDN